MNLILASASPRRRELLTQAGLSFTVEPANIDEDMLLAEPAAAYVQRLAVEKAQAVCALHQHDPSPFVVLAADTCVVVGSQILGKPVSIADAERMLEQLSGRTHAVMTGIAVVTRDRMIADVEITQVTFNSISKQEIAHYIQTRDCMDKAGGYGIQGYSARWIPRVEGDYFNVMGLPICRAVRLLQEIDEQLPT